MKKKKSTKGKVTVIVKIIKNKLKKFKKCIK